MTRAEFKKLYSEYRAVWYNFNQSMIGTPCGYMESRMLGLNAYQNGFLEQNPVISKVVDLLDATDKLEERQQNSYWYL